MARTLVRAAEHDRDRSLGHLAVAWMEYFVRHGPGDVQGMPVEHGQEYYDFIVDCYALDANARRLYDSAFLSRAKGCDKSGLGARLSLFEALGPCRALRDEDGSPVLATGGEVYQDPWGLGFEYEYQPGEPMGAPVTVPYIRCMATEEGQTGNVYDTIYFNLTDEDCPLSAVLARRDDAGLTRILLPGGGEITPSTSGSASKDGGKETFVVFDETHLYVRPDLRRMYATVVRNLRKRKKIAETWFLETTTMYAPGEASVAEETYKVAKLIMAGKTKRERLLLDHQYGPIAIEDLADENKLGEALRQAYGDALAWNDLAGMINGILDPRSDVADSIRYFLNDESTAENAYLAGYEWAGRSASALEDAGQPAPRPIAAGDVVTLGFDGSRSRHRGIADATALIGCRVEDGHVFEIEVWEQPKGVAGKGWEVPVEDVLAVVRGAFERYAVVGFYADPAKWESHVAAWERDHGPQLKVKSSRAHPIEWWMTGNRRVHTAKALEKFESAVLDGEMTHDGSSTLTRHVLAARKVSGGQIAKESPDSDKKIDACVAAVLAWQARLDALATGAGAPRRRSAPQRIR